MAIVSACKTVIECIRCHLKVSTDSDQFGSVLSIGASPIVVCAYTE